MTLKSPINNETLVQSGFQSDIASFESLNPADVMVRLYRESRLNSAHLSAEPRLVPDDLCAHTASPEVRRVALPPPGAESQALSQSVIERTAIRFYDRAPISPAQLGAILQAASGGDRRDWPQEEEAGVSLQFLVVAWRVEGIIPALYRYDPRTHELAHIGPAPTPEEGAGLVLQTEFADAPVIVFITGALAAACARYGSWGHRQLLLRAGAAGHRLWMASIGVGLVGTVFAGFLPRAANRIAGADGNLQASLLAYSAGRFPQHLIKAGSSEGGLSRTGKGGL